MKSKKLVCRYKCKSCPLNDDSLCILYEPEISWGFILAFLIGVMICLVVC